MQLSYISTVYSANTKRLFRKAKLFLISMRSNRVWGHELLNNCVARSFVCFFFVCACVHSCSGSAVVKSVYLVTNINIQSRSSIKQTNKSGYFCKAPTKCFCTNLVRVIFHMLTSRFWSIYRFSVNYYFIYIYIPNCISTSTRPVVLTHTTNNRKIDKCTCIQ